MLDLSLFNTTDSSTVRFTLLTSCMLLIKINNNVYDTWMFYYSKIHFRIKYIYYIFAKTSQSESMFNIRIHNNLLLNVSRSKRLSVLGVAFPETFIAAISHLPVSHILSIKPKYSVASGEYLTGSIFLFYQC